MLHTDLPEALTLVSAAEQELQCVLVRSMDLWVEFDKKPFPLEAELSDPGPVEGVDFGGALQSGDGHRVTHL